MTLNIAILEDNKSDYENLTSLLNEWGHTTNTQLNYTWFNNEDILKSFYNNKIDILFSDIDLSETSKNNGLAICKELREKGFDEEIIFLTAYKEYVFQGYNVRAFNYIVKPISIASVNNCMNKYLTLQLGNYYVIQDRAAITRVRYKDIIYIQKKSHDVAIYTTNGIFYERISLNEIQNKLPPHFVLCHKSYIVNMSHILSLNGNKLYLTNDNTVTVGRSHLGDVRDSLLNISQD